MKSDKAEARRRIILREEFEDFKSSYREARAASGSEWVDPRRLLNTGLMIRELAEAGYIDMDSGMVRPKVKL